MPGQYHIFYCGIFSQLKHVQDEIQGFTGKLPSNQNHSTLSLTHHLLRKYPKVWELHEFADGHCGEAAAPAVTTSTYYFLDDIQANQGLKGMLKQLGP